MFSDEELETDKSARDIWNGLYALEKGNITESMRYFDILEKRWNKIREKGEKLTNIVEKEFKNKGAQIIEFSNKEDGEP
ncbi:hypothetical protein DRI96_02915 [Candidatus Aerophobetes bacterium]|uniref:DUF8083 domain-containing protein n=1 Tax=Aerophobetes bacterium TaxID=2030807 RepID=A0A662DGS3_UNCAE|nr:MAG: hypothetical protein DRI96_02915 [Candidatus Aerophobetes bacterium]